MGMVMMMLKRKVVVKAILTKSFRMKLENEYKDIIQKMELELEQLQFQSKKLLQEALKKGPKAEEIVSDRLLKEEKKRREKLLQSRELLTQLSTIPDGSELEYAELEGDVEVKIGDDWDKLFQKVEIVVQDGLVVEIRE
jgi:hypothetical protein